MKFKKSYTLFISILFGAFILVAYGCGGQKINVRDLLNQPIEEAGNLNRSKKYITAGITVVYLTGTPYEIGFAHGKLCKDEITNLNRYYWDAYDKLKNTPDGKWLPLSRSLERYIPKEYITEMMLSAILHFIIGLNVVILARMRFQQLKSVRIIARYEDAKCVI